MNIKLFAQRLRHAADVLDGLIGLDRATENETPTVAKKIIKDLTEKKKPHWTQTTKGRALMSKRSKDAWAAKQKKE
jgi:hypothetical protein